MKPRAVTGAARVHRAKLAFCAAPPGPPRHPGAPRHAAPAAVRGGNRALPASCGAARGGGAGIWFLHWVLLVLLPVLLLWQTGARWQRQQEIDRLERRREAMAGVLRRAATMGEMRSRFQWVLERFVARAPTGPRLAAAAARLQHANRGILQLYLYDAAGRRIRLPGQPHLHLRASERFLAALRDPRASVPAKMVSVFAGNPGAPQLIAAAPRVLADLMNGDQRTWGGWWPLTDRTGRTHAHLVAFVSRGGYDADRLRDRASQDANRLTAAAGTVCGWWDPVTPDRIRPTALNLADLSPASLAAELAAGAVVSTRRTLLDRPAVVEPTAQGELLFAIDLGEPHPTGPPRRSWPSVGATATEWRVTTFGISASIGGHPVASGLALGWMLLGSALFGVGAKRGPSLPIRLRARLIAVFALSSGLSLVVLGGTAMINRQDRESIMLEQFRRQHLEQLTLLDGELTAWFQPIIRRYRQILQRCEAGVDPVTATRDLAAWIGQQGRLIIQVLVVDRAGRLQFHHHTDPNLKGGQLRSTRELMRGYTHRMLATFNGEDGSFGAESAEQSVMLNLARHTSGSLEGNRDLQAQDIGGQKLLTFIGLVHRHPARAEAVLVAQHRSQAAQTQHLRRALWTRRRDPLAIRLAAVPFQPGLDWPSLPRAATGRDPVCVELRDRVAVSRLPVHQIASVGRHRYLLSAMPGQMLDGYVLIAARPLAVIELAINQLDRQLLWFSLMVLTLTMVTAVATSRGLLHPIQALDRGLTALREHRFEHRIVAGQTLEFARMADQINHIMAELRDLQIARTVQEHLWPEAPIGGDGFEIFGGGRVATNLGGDHHDWLQLADGRVLVAVGDVAGHGIPSALVVAAAKVELALRAQIDPAPGTLLTAINQGLEEQVGRSRPMTMWLGLLDPARHRLDYACAGHSFPIALIGDRPPVMAGCPGYPLGVRRKTSYREDSLDLSPGATVYLYSDGLIEATDGNGQPFGYERLIATVQRHRSQSPRTAFLAILDEVSQWSRRAVPEDDQTLVIIRIDPVAQSPGKDGPA